VSPFPRNEIMRSWRDGVWLISCGTHAAGTAAMGKVIDTNLKVY
jgi:hypothetical protein